MNAAKKNFTFYTGSCAADEQEALARIRMNFLNAVANSPLANYALCTVSQGQDCVVENVKVYCGANSRRRRSSDSNDSGERIITFDFVITDKNASSDPKAEAAKYVVFHAAIFKDSSHVCIYDFVGRILEGTRQASDYLISSFRSMK